MSMCGSNNVGRAVQTLLAQKFDRSETLHNGIQQGVQMDATCNTQKCWDVFANNVVFVCT